MKAPRLRAVSVILHEQREDGIVEPIDEASVERGPAAVRSGGLKNLPLAFNAEKRELQIVLKDRIRVASVCRLAEVPAFFEGHRGQARKNRRNRPSGLCGKRRKSHVRPSRKFVAWGGR